MSRTARRWATGAGALLLATSANLLAGPAQAMPSQYAVVASATAGELSYTLQDFLVVSSLGGGAPTAQVTLDSTRGSYGFASAPYPGETVAGAPATVRGMGAPVPDFPTYVSSRDPSVPKQEKTDVPGLLLRSESAETSGDAIAKVGIDDQVPGGATGLASTAARTGNDATTGTAESDVQSFDLGGVLNVGRAHATASVSVSSSGGVKLATDFSAAVSIAGQPVAVTPKGLVAAGSTTPLPDSSPLVSALKSAGITLEYVEATKTKTGVVSAGLRITTTHVPPSQVPALGGVPIKGEYLLGQAAVSVRTATDSATTSTGVVGGDSSGGQSSGSTGAAPAPPTGPGGAGGLGAPPGTGGALAPAAPVVAQPEAPSSGRAAAPAALAPSALALDGGAGAVGFYLVLVLAAGAALFGATLVRLLGVRNLWT